jgi:ABC-type transporter Mla subunit MlaD
LRETAVESAYSLQQQLTAARSAAQLLGGQLGAMRASVSGETVAQLERVSRDLAKALAQLSAAITGAARVQAAMDAYEGAPTAAQLRELNWAWEDASAGVTALNQLIEESMPPLYGAAGASSRWTPLKPVPLPKR